MATPSEARRFGRKSPQSRMKARKNTHKWAQSSGPFPHPVRTGAAGGGRSVATRCDVRTLRLRAGFISLFVGAVVVAGFAAQRDGPPEIRLFDLTTARGVVDHKPFRPTGVFAPDDNPIYVWFRGEGCTTGTTIRSVWFYLETDPPLLLSEGAVTVDRPDDWGQFNFELARGRHWSVGEYRVELRVGDALLATTYFRVAPLETPRDEGRRRYASPPAS